VRRPTALLLAGVCAAAVTTLATPAEAAALHMSQLLGKLPVTAEVNTGYARSAFKHWVDADRNTCDTREEVLKAESKVKATTGAGCAVSRGRWVSAYDGKVFTAAGGLDIDHFVPLAEAWGSGARVWNAATREAFANDLGFGGSLIAVSASTNRSKGDKDPAAWLPPSAGYRCAYVGSWLQVKYRWQLTVDKTERARLATLVRSCKDPVVALPVRRTVTRVAVPAPTTPPPATGRATDPKYATCADAKKYGHAPYVRGRDAEYPWYRDADGDGLVCE
jgi:hypothetical protein